jgi:uncharacterized protein
MIIGLISDTHGLVRPQIATVFERVDLIVHAGDVGGAAVLSALQAIARVEAVGGNVDDPHDPALPRHRTIPIGRFNLHVSHGNELGSPTPERVAAAYDADVLVFGHTHRAVTVRIRDQLVVNPGAAGPRRFDLQPSVALLRVGKGAPRVEIVPLAAS